jgi:hypothetical protein
VGAWFLIVGVALVVAITWLLYQLRRRGGPGARWIWYAIGGLGFGEGESRWEQPLQGKWRLPAALALVAILAAMVIAIVLFWGEI